MSRRVIYVAAAVVLLLAGAAIYEFTKPVTFYGSVIEPPKLMADFALQSDKGLVKLSDFRGKYAVVFFGFTSCPDVCPTTLARLKAALNILERKDASQVQVILVSVDYKRDTPESVASYTKNFDPDFIGLTGTQAQIDQVTREFGIYYKLNDPDPATGYYSVDHTATILVLNQQGELALTWTDFQPDEMASDLKNLLRK